ncbi:hypothetical protein B0H15DRAFT_1028132, partial [Mycena belliarum]
CPCAARLQAIQADSRRTSGRPGCVRLSPRIGPPRFRLRPSLFPLAQRPRSPSPSPDFSWHAERPPSSVFATRRVDTPISYVQQ